MSAVLPDEVRAVAPQEIGVRRSVLAVMREHRVGMVGLGVLVLLILLAVLAPLIAPYSPKVAVSTEPYAGVSGAHLLGTDGESRDVLSRVLWGGRPALATAVLPALIALPPGILIGVLAAQLGSALEELLMRIVDIGLSFPGVLLAIAIAGVVGRGFWTVVLALAVALAPYIARVAYSLTQTLRSSDFIVAARATGESRWQILKWELLPNVLPPLIVYVTSLLGGLMVLAAGLSFFGLGVAPPTADWGQMINEGRVALTTAPLVSLAPSAMIVIAALCFSAIGDSVRDILDPRG